MHSFADFVALSFNCYLILTSTFSERVMSVKQQIENNEYRKLLKHVWNVKFDASECFPEEIKNWIVYNSTYIAWPLLVATSYCAQHSTVNATDFHKEPILLYGLVVGHSGIVIRLVQFV